jgi:peptidoglycan/LPS O-acetylase OafA/YrhL
MRALAATSVLLFHVWLFSSPDDEAIDLGRLTGLVQDFTFGVTLFFTLSGFLLYRPFVAALVRSTGRPSFRAYLRNRALRILPAYFVILLLSALVLRSVRVRDQAGNLETQGAPDIEWLLRNLSLTQNYTPSGVLTGIGPAWSLAVEVAFYLMLPGLVLIGAVVAKRTTTRSGRTLAALAPPMLLLVLGLAGKTASALVGSGADDGWGADWNSVLERSFLSHLDLFAFGMALAVVRVHAEDGLLRVGTRTRVAIAIAAVGAYVLTTTSMAEPNQLGNSRMNTVMALSCALFLALVVLPPGATRPSVIVRVLETRPFVLVGLVSYSIFLWHLPVILALNRQGLTMSGRLGFLVNAVVVFFVTLGLSVLTYRFVEEPALRRKRPVSSRSAETKSLGSASASADVA